MSHLPYTSRLIVSHGGVAGRNGLTELFGELVHSLNLTETTLVEACLVRSSAPKRGTTVPKLADEKVSSPEQRNSCAL